MEDCYQEAVIILEGGMIDYVHMVADLLLLNETIDASELEIVMKCENIPVKIFVFVFKIDCGPRGKKQLN